MQLGKNNRVRIPFLLWCLKSESNLIVQHSLAQYKLADTDFTIALFLIGFKIVNTARFSVFVNKVLASLGKDF